MALIPPSVGDETSMDGAAEFPDDAVIEGVETPIAQRLKHKSPLHKKILGKLIEIRDAAAAPIKDKHEEWNRVDEHMGLHVDLRRSSIKGDGSLDTTRKEIPFEKSLVVPVSFSVEKVIQAQHNSIRSGRDPQFQYDGNEPQDVAGAKLMEVSVAYDLRKGRFDRVSSQAIQNALRYGISPVYSCWHEDWGYMQKPMIQGPMAGALGKLMPDLVRPVRQYGKRFEYVRHAAIDPYRFRIDPRKSVSTFQEGDVIGHEFTESLLYFKTKLLEKEEGPYFNVEALESSGWSTDTYRSHGDEPGRSDSESTPETRSYDCEHLEIRLIPSEWELSDSDTPEIWWFEFVGDEIIVRCHPSPYDHGSFNYSVGAGYPDQNIILPMGMGQLIDPFQRFMTWIASSRFENVRRFINNAALVMEDYVEMEDVMNPMPAGHIRLKQAAQDLIALGVVSDARVFYPQLSLQDVTRTHLEDIQTLFEWVGRMTGANDMSQGIHLPSKRTATEVDKLMGAASQRSQDTAEGFDSMLFGPMAEMHSMIIQQYATDERWYRITGEMADKFLKDGATNPISRQAGGIHMKISPWDLYGAYDYIPYTGMDPNNPARSAENMMQLMQIISPIPQLNDPMAAMQMGEEEIADMKEFVLRIGENMKIKDVSKLFKVNPMIKMMQDAALREQKQAGNVVPAEQAM